MLECYTENRNRTVAEVRHAFTKSGGNLAENGSVSWQFKHVGQIVVSKEGRDEDEFTLLALEAGADDVVTEDDSYVVYTAVEDLHKANDALEKAGITASEVGLTYVATNKADLKDEDYPKLLKLLDALDELDDVQESYVNVDIPEEFLQEA
jgi:YebC/PmpR family DNA-binding regulatory protein